MMAGKENKYIYGRSLMLTSETVKTSNENQSYQRRVKRRYQIQFGYVVVSPGDI